MALRTYGLTDGQSKLQNCFATTAGSCTKLAILIIIFTRKIVLSLWTIKYLKLLDYEKLETLILIHLIYKIFLKTKNLKA